ncbi:Putative zinc ribbon domain-containing protein [Pseudozobellia thermophila]|uniref:Putative zinc ribbon domain-containing protein n=2 Tax=Pseudozobellia thermophila TaxID=192903 RepID=A0A1M6ILD6_9FLAO|nr:Putative zinc ribbon domain-containing protein [Pseudozobellia thermophila]
MKALASNICENCGRPMHHLYDFGTNKDGTINTEYCHSCYVRGKFVNHGKAVGRRPRKKVGKKREVAL